MKKILFISKQRIDQYGVAFGLVNSSRFCSEFLAKSLPVETKSILVVDGNAIDREVSNYNPDIVILEALWVTPDKIRELLKIRRHHHRTWIIRLHSKAPFLANEGVAFEWLNSYREIIQKNHNLHISVNNDEFCKDLSSVMKTSILYLPNLYPIKDKSQPALSRSCNDIIRIGCFGAVRPLKNHVEQAIAAIRFADRINKKLWFNVNSNRFEQKGEEVMKNLRALFSGTKKHTIIEHNWSSHEEFFKVVRLMDIGMQVSMTESFNIVTADFVANRIPVVVSKDIDWVPLIWRCDPTDTDEIVMKLRLAWSFRGTAVNLLALRWYNMKALRAWEKFIQA